jgi:hypothetical protein
MQTWLGMARLPLTSGILLAFRTYVKFNKSRKTDFRFAVKNGGGLSSTGTLACAGFAIVVTLGSLCVR